MDEEPIGALHCLLISVSCLLLLPLVPLQRAPEPFRERHRRGVPEVGADAPDLRPRVPHVAVNRSRTETAVFVGVRNEPTAQESVVMLPELDSRVP